MDCNKEEAIRSREIAEKKMESKDFTGARKFALKAQQLFPDMENISQMLMVCDVHCASEKRLFGTEMDWYGILQIEQTANEAVIRKQFRKYALLLHPDKNKFIGAEAAFKLVGEAQRVLLDPEKRRLHDIRRKPAVPYRPPQRATPTFNVGVQTNFRNNFTSFVPPHQPPPQQGQSGFVHNRATFWTVCPFCSVRYQYYKEVVNRSLCCQNCKKPFIACDMEVRGAHPQPMTNLNQTSFFQQQNSFNHKAEVGRQSNSQSVKHRTDSCQEVGRQSNSQSVKHRTESCQKARTSSSSASEKFNGKKRRKQTSDSSKSCDTGNSSDFEENVVADEDRRRDVGRSGEHHPRRSNRHRQRVSYNENLSSNDNDHVITPKKSKRSNTSSCSDKDNDGAYEDDEASKVNNQSGSANVADNQKESKKQENNYSEGRVRRSKESKETVDTNGYQKSVESPGDSESNFLSCSDADFNDFDKLRDRECFALKQIWAMYDDVDTMPRFYAWIKKVFPSGFKVQITWLEPVTKEEGQSKCVDKKLPVSCGEYKFGSTETMTDCGSMFSHSISWEKGGRRDSFKIYPRKGQVWALFKNWDKNGNCDSSCQYKYEFVETLSEYTEEAGVDVGLLAKVKGFSSLFCRMVKEGEKSFQVPAAELFRFSHQVPSFPLTGDEREDVPKGSFELDPAALPSNLPEIAIPKHLKQESANIGPNTLKSMMGCNGAAATPEADIKSDNDDSECVDEAIEVPDPEFFNFDAEKSCEKFQIDQIWALYSDEDCLPRYYGHIKKITKEPEFKLNLMWLESSALPSDTIKWHDKGMPISCGKFATKRTKMHYCTSTDSFSHLVRAVPTTTPKNGFSISPTKGEVWALYKNWTPEIRCSDLDKCEYDVVEVIQDNDLQIEVLVLERIDGFNSVFKAQVKNASKLTMGITRAELLRFSHQIPAFKLTDERGGSVRGYWELDPAALPVCYFS